MSSDRVRVYKRLETDDEFRKRAEATRRCILFCKGQALDDEAWNYYQMQRRIVEDQR